MHAGRALGLMKDILAGLLCLHERGIVHRDLKCRNVLLSDGVAKLSDFGVAVHGGSSEGGSAVGTPQYMPPEVLNGAAADAPGDVWAAGCLLLELSTGLTPFHHRAGGTMWGGVKYVSGLSSTDRVDLGAHPFHPEVLRVLRQCLGGGVSTRVVRAGRLAAVPFLVAG
eukprot:Hpha_TRINITY_DN13443_c0_g2::TRINITY_DN13443_c0_g2_i1::g.131308::m.131308